MGIVRNVVYLSKAQLDDLIANGTITVDGTTITYSPDDIYMTPTNDSNYIENGTNEDVSFGGNVAVGSGKLLKVYYMRTTSRAVAANGYTTYDDALSPGDGWTPLAVVGYYVSAGQNYPYTVKISDSNNYLDVRLHNTTSTAFDSVYIDVYVLCVRTSL